MAVSFKVQAGTYQVLITYLSLVQSVCFSLQDMTFFSIMIMTIYRKQRLELCDRSESAMLIDFFLLYLVIDKTAKSRGLSDNWSINVNKLSCHSYQICIFSTLDWLISIYT